MASVLTFVCFAGNRTRGVGAHALGEALKMNTSITDLNLKSNWARCVSRQGFPMLICAFAANRIGSEGAHALADALRVNADVTRQFWSVPRHNVPPPLTSMWRKGVAIPCMTAASHANMSSQDRH